MQLTIDNETFRVEVEGADSRPVVLLSPSLGTDLSLFDAQMPALLEHFRVVRYDPRGHGGSTITGAPYSLARLGRDAVAILDALGIATTHFVGISMGGAVGQWLLVNAPERIDRAVLANTAARIGTPESWNARIATVLAHGTPAIAAATMDRWFSPAFRERAPQRVAAVEAAFRKTSSEGYAGACAALRDMDLRRAIISIDRPVLVVSGRDDAVTSEADIAALTGAIGGAQHVELDCRHISNIEEAAAFDAAMIAFLTAPVPARAGRPSRKPALRRATGRASAARSPLKPVRVKETKDGVGAKATRSRATPAEAARRAARGAVATATSEEAAKKAAAETGEAKKGATKKAADNKTAAKKTARKPAAGRPARKSVAVRPSKAPAKPATKPAAKRTTTKKATKKTSPTTPLARRPSRKRPGRPGGRKR